MLLAMWLASVPLAAEPIQLNDDNLEWSDGPASIPAGAKFVLLEGDPAGDGIFAMRVFLPPKYVIPFHWHDADERVTVLEGSVEIGIGETKESAFITRFQRDGYYVTPPPLRHFVRAGPEGCVLQLTGLGPWTIHYVDKKDDPRDATRNAERDARK
jgi:quercetin dioxygenase-like cupin family protein